MLKLGEVGEHTVERLLCEVEILHPVLKDDSGVIQAIDEQLIRRLHLLICERYVLEIEFGAVRVFLVFGLLLPGCLLLLRELLCALASSIFTSGALSPFGTSFRRGIASRSAATGFSALLTFGTCFAAFTTFIAFALVFTVVVALLVALGILLIRLVGKHCLVGPPPVVRQLTVTPFLDELRLTGLHS